LVVAGLVGADLVGAEKFVFVLGDLLLFAIVAFIPPLKING